MNYLIFGGTGSLGTVLVKRLLDQNRGIYVFSRSEEKHRVLRDKFSSHHCINNLHNIIGDVRDRNAVFSAVLSSNASRIINAAALKQIPACEDFPYEALLTNTVGEKNIADAVLCLREGPNDPEDEGKIKFLSISTDKACNPINAYAFTKALQERIHLRTTSTYIISNLVRYGNVLESTGSVIPVFKELVSKGKKLRITDARMTRFLLSLDQAVDLIFKALNDKDGGKIFIPKIKSAKMTDLAECYSSENFEITGIRPGEKIDEILISKEEWNKTEDLGKFFAIHQSVQNDLNPKEYSSGDFNNLMSKDELKKFLKEHNVL